MLSNIKYCIYKLKIWNIVTLIQVKAKHEPNLFMLQKKKEINYFSGLGYFFFRQTIEYFYLLEIF